MKPDEDSDDVQSLTVPVKISEFQLKQVIRLYITNAEGLLQISSIKFFFRTSDFIYNCIQINYSFANIIDN